jgi:hypothetical protein
MCMMRYFILALWIGFSIDVVAQSKKKDKSKAGSESISQQPSSLSPNTGQQSQSVKSKSKSKTSSPKLEVTYDAERKYYQRVKRVAKEQIKAEKELQKPQYSDPLYFGHKKPPKKRPAGKMKYCKECGMKH